VQKEEIRTQRLASSCVPASSRLRRRALSEGNCIADNRGGVAAMAMLVRDGRTPFSGSSIAAPAC